VKGNYDQHIKKENMPNEWDKNPEHTKMGSIDKKNKRWLDGAP